MAPKGEATIGFEAGENEAAKREFPIPAEGRAQVVFTDIGKPGALGLKRSNPTKYPYRRAFLEVVGQEDENGKPFKISEIFSLSPKAWFRVEDWRHWGKYTEPMDRVPAPNSPNHPSVRTMAEYVELMLQSFKDNGTVFDVELAHDTNKGRTFARIAAFLPPEEGGTEETAEEAPTEEPAEEEVTDAEYTEATADEPAAEEPAEEPAEEEEEEEPAPKPAAKKPALVAVKSPPKKVAAKPAPKKAAGGKKR